MFGLMLKALHFSYIFFSVSSVDGKYGKLTNGCNPFS
jgi:hypothetical protein